MNDGNSGKFSRETFGKYIRIARKDRGKSPKATSLYMQRAFLRHVHRYVYDHLAEPCESIFAQIVITRRASYIPASYRKLRDSVSNYQP